MRDRLNKWIIRKLGGISYSDLPHEIRLQIVEYQARAWVDIQMAKVLKGGFTTKYVEPEP